MKLDKKQMKEVKKRIKEMYSMDRLPTDQEMDAELVNLDRRKKLGAMDYRYEHLNAMLERFSK